MPVALRVRLSRRDFGAVVMLVMLVGVMAAFMLHFFMGIIVLMQPFHR